MTRLRSLLLGHCWLALVVVLVALAVRLAVPPGLMPGHDRDGATFTVCTGHGAVTVPGDPKPARPDAPCAFAGLGVAIAAADGFAVAPAAEPRYVPDVAPRPVDVTGPPARLRPPQRGPPEPRAA